MNVHPVLISNCIKTNECINNDYEAIKNYFTECNNETNKNCEMTYEHVFTDFILQLQEIQKNWVSGMRCIQDIVNDVTSYMALLSLTVDIYTIDVFTKLKNEIKSLQDNIQMEIKFKKNISELSSILGQGQNTTQMFINRYYSSRIKKTVIKDLENEINELQKKNRSYHREVHLYF